MHRIGRLVLSAALTLQAAPLVANDSTAERAAGGLVLRQSDAIDMLSEDLYVSTELIRVDYVFRNQSDVDVTTLVAFPMPDRDLEQDRYGDVAYPSGFETLVDGAPVDLEVEIRAFLGETEHTALLRELGVPLASEHGAWEIGRALDALPRDARDRLIEAGLAETTEYDAGEGLERHLEPLWTVRETWFWEQTFPAGEDVRIRHAYAPGAGGGFNAMLADADFRESEFGRQMIADYCIDANVMAGIERLHREAGEGDATPIILDRAFTYILTTGGNWRSPIGEFRLVVDKGAPENIVSFCGEGVRRISPTEFEVRHTDWRPDRDLKVIVFSPIPGY
ncbi:MAG: DUF4424 domain-containing protein [Parasphingopyxis sp.]|nr:DUF4424 domain-containing protein [Sphingomonadales bacterium]